MIAKLSGIVDSTGKDWIILDVQGVGYLVSCSTRTLDHMPNPGEATQLWIETWLRQDALTLFGFHSVQEKEWFLLLTTVQGVGAKVALAILSILGPQELFDALATQDKARFTQADGVGPRLGERIVNELKTKYTALGSGNGGGAFGVTLSVVSDAREQEAQSALVNLGYKPQEAQLAIRELLKQNPQQTIESLIRGGLQHLMKGTRAS